MNSGMVEADFHELGLGEPNAISSAHGEGVRGLVDLALAAFPEPEEEEEKSDAVRVAIVGRPNVGKSTLVNTLLGEERVIAFDAPGTTRDAIEIDFERGGRKYVLVDTAGMRKRGKVFESIEKFSVVKTLKSIEDANVVILMVDAQADVSEQDAHIADFIVQSGRALVVAVNKWDGLDSYTREQTRLTLQRKLKFLDFAKFHFISARDNIGLEAMFRSVDAAFAAAMTKMSTPRLARVLGDAVAKQAPPKHGVFRPKPRYAHQGGSNPPIIVVHGNAVDQITDSYRRYLEHTFREAFKLQGTPLRIQFVTSKNPFADKDKK
jgi:GTP-binding protein